VRRFLSLATVAFALAGCGGAANPLPYDRVTFNAAAARRAFAAENVDLAVKSKGPSGTMLGDRRDVFEVDVFGAPAELRREGFEDLPHARDCAVAGHLALHWRGNVRVVLNCRLVRHPHQWVAKMKRALAALD
jgi:hypothetical protein